MIKNSFEATLANFLQFSRARLIFFIWATEDQMSCLTFSSVSFDYCKLTMMFSSSIRLVFALDKLFRISSSIFFIFCSLSLLRLINSILLLSNCASILLITTLVSCSSKPFSFTVKLTRTTLVVTQGLYLGFGSLVVMNSLKFSLYLISLSPR